jgi:squalene synthase HpnC
MAGNTHCENFPVASILLPARLRPAVLAIYAFARSADDIADEGNVPDALRLEQLDAYLAQLDRIEAKQPAHDELFAALNDVIHEHRLPLAPFRALISAFAQDVTVKRYARHQDVMSYCRRSADPVGQLLLYLFGAATEENLHRSDCICSSLQLINFLQDIEIDYRKGRIYLPQDEMRRFAVDEQQLARGDTTGAWWPLLRFQVQRARELLFQGAPLARALPGRMGLEIKMIVMGGERILKKIEQCRGDVFTHRPVLKSWDWPTMFLRALFAYP